MIEDIKNQITQMENLLEEMKIKNDVVEISKLEKALSILKSTLDSVAVAGNLKNYAQVLYSIGDLLKNNYFYYKPFEYDGDSIRPLPSQVTGEGFPYILPLTLS